MAAIPRLILIWMTTEAVRTRSRELELGSSLSSFMAQLGLQATGGHWGTIPRFRDQMQRLLGCAISTRWSEEANGQAHSAGNNLLLADSFNLWWTPQKLAATMPAKSSVTLSANFFDQVVEAPVPLDLRAIRALKRSPLALDLYSWATRRVSYLSRPTPVSWRSLQVSSGRAMRRLRKGGPGSGEMRSKRFAGWSPCIPASESKVMTAAFCFFHRRHIFPKSQLNRRRLLFSIAEGGSRQIVCPRPNIYTTLSGLLLVFK